MTTLLRRQSNALGVVLATFSFAVFAASDAIAKLLAASYHPIQVVGMRQMGLVTGVLLWMMFKGTSGLRTEKPKLQILRGLCASTSAVLMVIALRYVPLMDATTIAFAAPFFVTILGGILLKEPIGPRRWFAITAGFLGTLIVIRPGFEGFHPAYFLVLIGAFLFALRQIISRNLSATETTFSTVAYTAGVSISVLGVGMVFVWTPIAPEHVIYFVLYATLAATGELLVIKALEIAFAVVIAPIQYTMIVWTSLFGFMLFDALPDKFTLLGSAIIVVSGCFTIWREYQISKAKKARKA